ncbi:MAG: sulfite exporter TauE/SafE family protein [Rhodospirillales bacterium]
MIDPQHLDPAFLALFAGVLILAGAAAGLLAGLLGVGGGIVIVPVLYMLLPLAGIGEEVRMHIAVGTSLATIIPTSIMSARAHHKRGGLDIDLFKSLAPAIVIGAIVGVALGGKADGKVLTLIFATLALMVAAHMALAKEDSPLASTLPGGIIRQIIGLVIGGFSVVMGIGGGTLSVPILSSFAVPIRRAVGTASAFGLVISLPGTIGFITAGWDKGEQLAPFSLGYVNLPGVALIVPLTMMTAPLGARIAHSIPPGRLRLAFGFFLLLTSVRMFYGALTS